MNLRNNPPLRQFGLGLIVLGIMVFLTSCHFGQIERWANFILMATGIATMVFGYYHHEKSFRNHRVCFTERIANMIWQKVAQSRPLRIFSLGLGIMVTFFLMIKALGGPRAYWGFGFLVDTLISALLFGVMATFVWFLDRRENRALITSGG